VNIPIELLEKLDEPAIRHLFTYAVNGTRKYLTGPYAAVGDVFGRIYEHLMHEPERHRGAKPLRERDDILGRLSLPEVFGLIPFVSTRCQDPETPANAVPVWHHLMIALDDERRSRRLTEVMRLENEPEGELIRG
jgi:hypothetical protein